MDHTGVDLIQWSAWSPDLNRIENLWALLARHVYANGGQFYLYATLRKSISASWQ